MTTTTDTTTDTATVEPQPAVTPETATVDTETPETPEASPEAGTDDAEDQDDVEDQDAADAGGKGNKEAARYRRRLRSTEQERDQLAERVTALQRAEVERLATADDLRPAALWASAELGDLLSDDGTVDEAKVSQAIGAAREQLGIPNPPPRGNYVKGEGRSPGRPPRPSGLDAMVGAVMGRDGRAG
jgi:hypothetical protein